MQYLVYILRDMPIRVHGSLQLTYSVQTHSVWAENSYDIIGIHLFPPYARDYLGIWMTPDFSDVSVSPEILCLVV